MAGELATGIALSGEPTQAIAVWRADKAQRIAAADREARRKEKEDADAFAKVNDFMVHDPNKYTELYLKKAIAEKQTFYNDVYKAYQANRSTFLNALPQMILQHKGNLDQYAAQSQMQRDYQSAVSQGHMSNPDYDKFLQTGRSDQFDQERAALQGVHAQRDPKTGELIVNAITPVKPVDENKFIETYRSGTENYNPGKITSQSIPGMPNTRALTPTYDANEHRYDVAKQTFIDSPAFAAQHYDEISKLVKDGSTPEAAVNSVADRILAPLKESKSGTTQFHNISSGSGASKQENRDPYVEETQQGARYVSGNNVWETTVQPNGRSVLTISQVDKTKASELPKMEVEIRKDAKGNPVIAEGTFVQLMQDPVKHKDGSNPLVMDVAYKEPGTTKTKNKEIPLTPALHAKLSAEFNKLGFAISPIDIWNKLLPYSKGNKAGMGQAAKAKITQEGYGKLKSGEKYFWNGQEYTKQ